MEWEDPLEKGMATHFSILARSEEHTSELQIWEIQIPVALMVKNLPANAGDIRDAGSVPRSGRSPGEGNGTPLQYSCLENPTDRGAWWATVHKVAKSWT